MLKIKYPKNRQAFEKEFLGQLAVTGIQKNYEKLKKKAPLSKLKLPDDVTEILTGPIEKIARWSFDVVQHQKCQPECGKKGRGAKKCKPGCLRKELLSTFNYGYYDTVISAFFLQQQKNSVLNLKTCFFCNMTFIYAFENKPEYINKENFYWLAPAKAFHGIAYTRQLAVKKLLDAREAKIPFKDLSAQQKGIVEHDFLKAGLMKKHFTLDHFLHKSLHPLLGLSLYNFVPSCYACNSLMKGDKAIAEFATEVDLSPTHSDFKLQKEFQFRLYFNEDCNLIAKSDDFLLLHNRTAKSNRRYLNIFKILPRYRFHKDIILDLIKKSQQYPDSRIQEMADQVGLDWQSLKEHIYGKNLFHGDCAAQPMTKMLRDVAEDIELTGTKSSADT